ncbi:hypothetical protein MY10362_004801 [Beauveria mimosiformis]
MKTPIILATLFASSLAAVPLPLPGTGSLQPQCFAADPAILVALEFARPRLPKCGNMKGAIAIAIAAFKHKIGCGDAPPEPEAPPADQRCSKAECDEVDETIRKGKGVFKDAFLILPPKFDEAVQEASRVCKKKLGCKEEAKVTV